MPYKLNPFTGKFDFTENSADNIIYNNNTSGLAVTNVQNAIDSISTEIVYDVTPTEPFQSFLEVTSGLANLAFSSFNFIYWVPIHVKRKVTIYGLAYFSNGSYSGNSVWGLYESSKTNGLPTNLLFQSTPFDNLIISSRLYTLPTPITINPGIYYYAYSSSSILNVRTPGITVYPNILGYANANVTYNYIAKSYVYNGVFPATYASLAVSPVKGVSNHPHVIFKII
jgi:hypothetical protein